MKLDKIPEHILSDLRERMSDGEIERSSPEECFHQYCHWHGLIDWGHSLVRVLDQLRNSE